MRVRKINKRKRALKLFLFFLNLLFIFFGIALVVLGAWISFDQGDFSEVLGSALYASGTYILVFTGLVIIVLALVGYIGTEKENRFLLILYVGILIISLILIFIAAVVVLAYKDTLTSLGKAALEDSLRNKYGRYLIVTKAWDFIQKKLRCCAVDDRGWEIYRNSWWDLFINANVHDRQFKIPETNQYYLFVPESCCWTLVDPRTGWPSDEYRNLAFCRNWQYGPPNFPSGPHNDAIYYRGCFASLKSYLSMYSKGLGSVSICLAIFMIIGIVCTILLLTQIDARRRATM